MTTNYHTPITTGASNAVSTINTPLSGLDSQITTVTSEIAAARGAYTDLDARLDALLIGGGGIATATLASSTATASVTVGTGEADSFTASAPVAYLVGGVVEYGVVLSASGNLITLSSAPSGTISSGTVITQISRSEYEAAQAIPYDSTAVSATLPKVLDWAAGDVANVLAYGADNTGVSDCGAAVQEAVDNNSIVYFPPGTYLFNTQVTTGDNVTIVGHGATLKYGTAVPLQIDGDNVAVRGLKFLGTMTDHTSNANGGGGLQIDGTADHDNISVIDCHFSWLNWAISWVSPDPVDDTITVTNVRVVGCTFVDLMRHYMYFKKAGSTAQTNFTVKNLRIIDCHMQDVYNTDTYIYSGGLYIGGGVTLENLVIADCTMNHCLTSAIVCASDGYINKGAIVGCSIKGLGATTDNRMGIELTNGRSILISGCNIDYVAYECITLYGVESFTVSGCTFRDANIGIGLYSNGTIGSNGNITGCTFDDIEDPTAVGNTAKRGILLNGTDLHRCSISNCFFTKSDGGSTAVRVESAAHELDVHQCNMYNLGAGISLAGAGIDYRVNISQCRFDTVTTGVSSGVTLQEMVIRDCYFTGCTNDVQSTGNSNYVRAVNNTHIDSSTTAYELRNSVGSMITGCTFRDVAATVTGSGRYSADGSNNLIWRDNLLIGTSPAPASANNGLWYAKNSSDNVIAFYSAAPTTGSWSRGDIVYDSLPTASGTIGWVCVSGGSPGTWKTFGSIAA